MKGFISDKALLFSKILTFHKELHMYGKVYRFPSLFAGVTSQEYIYREYQNRK